MIDAANDRAPRDRRPALVRFVESLSNAVSWLWIVATISVLVALVLHATTAALLFTGSAIGAGLTLCLISAFARRING